MRQGLIIAACALCQISCGSSDPERVGHVAQGVTSICGDAPAVSTFDGYPAFKYCGNFDVYSNDGKNTSSTPQAGWVKTEGGYGYQCVELAVRYFHFRWGISTGWGVMGAKDMCGTHPSGVSQTSNPVAGDLMVFGASSCGADPTFGHVGVVDSVSGTTISLVQQNTASKYNYKQSCASCFLHAASNSGGSVTDPCATAPTSGLYCGESNQWGGGDPGYLYDCQGGATASKQKCTYGCNAAPAGTADTCNPAPSGTGGTGGGAGAATGGAAGAPGGWSGASSTGGASGAGWVQEDAGPGGATGTDAGAVQHAATLDNGAGCNASGRRPSTPTTLLALALGVALVPLRRRRTRHG